MQQSAPTAEISDQAVDSRRAPRRSQTAHLLDPRHLTPMHQKPMAAGRQSEDHGPTQTASSPRDEDPRRLRARRLIHDLCSFTAHGSTRHNQTQNVRAHLKNRRSGDVSAARKFSDKITAAPRQIASRPPQ